VISWEGGLQQLHGGGGMGGGGELWAVVAARALAAVGLVQQADAGKSKQGMPEGDDRAHPQQGGTKTEVGGLVWLQPGRLAAASRTTKAAAGRTRD
jgi:hypothetical protein